MRAWWIVLLAGCGGHAAKPATPAPKGPQIALAEVDAKAFGVVHAASYLIVGADGKLQIGAVDARGEVDVSALTPTATDDLGGWFYVEAPPIPRPPGEEQMGILGSMNIGALGGLGSGFGDVLGDTGEYPTTTTGCGTALHLDAAADTPVALLIADAGADAHAVLAALEQMPRPVALVARGNDPRAQTLRLIVDGTANLTSDYPQGVVQVRDGESAGELLAAIGEHAANAVGEVVIDLGATCTVIDMSGAYGYGGFGDDPNMWGNDVPTDGYNDGWGTIGTGSGGGGAGYGVGYGGGYDLPLVSVGLPEVTGDVDAYDLQERLGIMSPELGDCLAVEPDSAGVVTVKVSFTAEGKVTKATATGVTDTLDRCVEELIRAIPFPEGTAKARATIPIKFGA